MNRCTSPVKQKVWRPTSIANHGHSKGFTIDEMHDAHERVKNNFI